MANEGNEDKYTELHKVVSEARCEYVSQLMTALYKGAEGDPRGEHVGQEVAVCIGNKCVLARLVEYEDGTRAVYLEGV